MCVESLSTRLLNVDYYCTWRDQSAIYHYVHVVRLSLSTSVHLFVGIPNIPIRTPHGTYNRCGQTLVL